MLNKSQDWLNQCKSIDLRVSISQPWLPSISDETTLSPYIGYSDLLKWDPWKCDIEIYWAPRSIADYSRFQMKRLELQPMKMWSWHPLKCQLMKILAVDSGAAPWEFNRYHLKSIDFWPKIKCKKIRYILPHAAACPEVCLLKGFKILGLFHDGCANAIHHG